MGRGQQTATSSSILYGSQSRSNRGQGSPEQVERQLRELLEARASEKGFRHDAALENFLEQSVIPEGQYIAELDRYAQDLNDALATFKHAEHLELPDQDLERTVTSTHVLVSRAGHRIKPAVRALLLERASYVDYKGGKGRDYLLDRLSRLMALPQLEHASGTVVKRSPYKERLATHYRARHPATFVQPACGATLSNSHHSWQEIKGGLQGPTCKKCLRLAKQGPHLIHDSGPESVEKQLDRMIPWIVHNMVGDVDVELEDRGITSPDSTALLCRGAGWVQIAEALISHYGHAGQPLSDKQAEGLVEFWDADIDEPPASLPGTVF